VAQTEIDIDGSGFQAIDIIEGKRSFGPFEKGGHIITIRTYDNAGNFQDKVITFNIGELTTDKKDDGGGGGIVILIIIIVIILILIGGGAGFFFYTKKQKETETETEKEPETPEPPIRTIPAPQGLAQRPPPQQLAVSEKPELPAASEPVNTGSTEKLEPPTG
jgi:uncharacterized protein YneF (UPF0154 family)